MDMGQGETGQTGTTGLILAVGDPGNLAGRRSGAGTSGRNQGAGRPGARTSREELRQEDGAVAPDGVARDVAGWQQPELLLEQGRVRSRGDRPSESVRQAGLVGIAQAREALAEAVRRAKSRAETKAA